MSEKRECENKQKFEHIQSGSVNGSYEAWVRQVEMPECSLSLGASAQRVSAEGGRRGWARRVDAEGGRRKMILTRLTRLARLAGL